jgi:uncharacterized protein YjbI with pentapeptide repeats
VIQEEAIVKIDLTKSLVGADLHGADLQGTDLSYRDLSSANLAGANLIGSNLKKACLIGADLNFALLCYATLIGANLTGANLKCCELRGADLSGSIGLLDPSDWLTREFETDLLGVLVYKRIGNNGEFDPPDYWKIESGEVLAEVCNPDCGTICGCGVNFGTLSWCMQHYPDSDLWLCRIAWTDLAGVVVPYNSDGKARCSRLTLLGKVPMPSKSRYRPDVTQELGAAG